MSESGVLTRRDIRGYVFAIAACPGGHGGSTRLEEDVQPGAQRQFVCEGCWRHFSEAEVLALDTPSQTRGASPAPGESRADPRCEKDPGGAASPAPRSSGGES